ncbi:MAG: alkaline shock response membrane anchor protein AmaP [Clostridia bacterium]|nr:alkaline shock response membrane anchor protein AmaP [Clostridia bacterium]
MKMKLFDRLILRFGALLTLVTGGISLAAGILLTGHDLGEGVIMQSLPAALIAAGAVAIIISALNFLVARRNAARRKAFITQPNEMGELRIAVSAIENLILKCVESHKELKVQEMNVSNHRGAIDVDLRVSMNSNVSIPHAVEQLQSQIKRYLAASSGIEVRNITVSVDRTPVSVDALPQEPLAEPEKIESRAEEKEKEKIPMHQRIFGRDPEKPEAEQVAEAEMIAPPVEDDTTESEETPVQAPAEAAAEEPAEEESAQEAPAETEEKDA